MKFSYLNPTQIHFGQGQIEAIRHAIPATAKVLVIYGGGSIKNNGIYAQVERALADHRWVEFSGVGANPTVEILDQAVAIVKEQALDFILAVGGGSVIDGAKYVAAAAMYDGEGWDILLGKYRVTKALPLGAVLTLPATGSESNGCSVIGKAATSEKLAVVAAALYPQFAILDPEVMKSLPERQIMNGLADAWVHVCEQYLTYPQGALVQDGYAEALLKSLITLAASYAERDALWHANLMWTANQALNGLIGVGVAQDWSTHMIGHEITALYGLDHARSLAVVQPSLLRHQLEVKRAKLEQLGRNVFTLTPSDDLAERTILAIEAFYQELNVATHFDGYQEEKSQAIERVIQQLQKHGLVELGEHHAISPEQTRRILEQAF